MFLEVFWVVMEDLPRAKRLRLLREAKERKEKQEKKPVDGKDDTAVEDEKSSCKSQADAGIEPKEDLKVVSTENDQTDKDDDEDVLLAPKRANWDIERDLAPMLKKLERRTQRAIVEILRTSSG